METITERNAVIEAATIGINDHGLLDVWLMLDYGGSGQGFGGWALYLPPSFTHHDELSPFGHYLYRCMKIAGVEDWSKMVGKTVRVRQTNWKVVAIGHIVKDDWFDPSEWLRELQKRDKDADL